MTSVRSAIQRTALLAGAATLLVSVGCKKTADNTINYKSAINAYYSAHPSCLWQIGASDQSQNAPFAALVDQGLLQRTTSEKKIIIVSKQEINYDLTSQGRSAWTADPNQPGYGNFCYGSRSVSSVDSSTPNNGQPGATTTVTYHYTFSGAPSWAKNNEIQSAFPQVATDLSGSGTGSANLVDTSNGWQVQGQLPTGSSTATPADGKIVQ
jgi:hypothetical protein